MKLLSNKAYDILKWIVMVFLPALNVFIFALGEALGFDSHTICGVIAAVTTFLGALIGVSTIGYNKEQNPDK